MVCNHLLQACPHITLAVLRVARLALLLVLLV
jgi:hypothetical protein